MINKIVFESNDSWEETITYFYENKDNINEEEFLKQVGYYNKNFKIQDDNKNHLEYDDFNTFLKKINIDINLNKLRIRELVKDWDENVQLISDGKYWILRVWETSA